MADLTPVDEKLGEVLGLAQAAQAAAEKVGGMERAADFEADLRRASLSSPPGRSASSASTSTQCGAHHSSSPPRRSRRRPVRVGIATDPASKTIAVRGSLDLATAPALCAEIEQLSEVESVGAREFLHIVDAAPTAVPAGG